MEIKNIVFDFYGVIANINPLKLISKISFADFFNSILIFFNYLTKSGFKKKFKFYVNNLQLGKITTEQFSSFVNNQLSKKGNSINNIFNSIPLVIQNNDDIIKLIKYLKQHRFSVYILSNTIPQTEDLIIKIQKKYMIDGVYFSTKEGKMKPDVQTYLDACSKWGINPLESIFVDDKKQNVKGALQAGFKHSFNFKKETTIETILQKLE